MAGASDDHNRIAGKQELTVLRRGRSQAWQAEVIEGPSGVLKLPEIKVEIPLARIYERTAISRSKR